MKKLVTMMVAAIMALSFSMVAFAAEEKAVEKTEKAEKKDVKKAKKDVKKDDKKKDAEAKPAARGKKEVSGC